MGRKYRHRGYQEEEERDAGHRKTSGRSQEGPRGRGLGAPTDSFFACARCGARVVEDVDLATTCSQCGSDLHTCTNCAHFDSSAVNECRQQVPRRIAAKAKRNECKQFVPRVVRGFASEAGTSSEEGKTAFDALFDL